MGNLRLGKPGGKPGTDGGENRGQTGRFLILRSSSFVFRLSHPTAQFRNWIPHSAFQDRMHCTPGSRLIAFLKFFFSMRLLARPPTISAVPPKRDYRNENEKRKKTSQILFHPCPMV